MLVLRRTEGQWTVIRCSCGCGHSTRVRVYNIGSGEVRLAFDDDSHHFQYERPERVTPRLATEPRE